jgi:hypothetical protein
MDNFSLRLPDDVIAVLTNTRVRIITFTSHTSPAFQMLDVVLFNALEKHATSLEMLNEESGTVAFILKFCYDFKQTKVEINI